MSIISFFQQNIQVSDWFSAFMGFGSALLVEAIISIVKNKKQTKELIASLMQELVDVQSKAQRQINKSDIIYDTKPYSIPIWESACVTGALSLLHSTKYYVEITKTFSFIQEANEFEYFCFRTSFQTHKIEELQLLNEDLISTRKKIIDKTTDLLKILKNTYV